MGFQIEEFKIENSACCSGSPIRRMPVIWRHRTAFGFGTRACAFVGPPSAVGGDSFASGNLEASLGLGFVVESFDGAAGDAPPHCSLNGRNQLLFAGGGEGEGVADLAGTCGPTYAVDVVIGYDWNVEDWIVYNDRRYDVAEVEELDFNAGWLIIGKEVKGVVPERIIGQNVVETMIISDEETDTKV